MALLVLKAANLWIFLNKQFIITSHNPSSTENMKILLVQVIFFFFFYNGETNYVGQIFSFSVDLTFFRQLKTDAVECHFFKICMFLFIFIYPAKVLSHCFVDMCYLLKPFVISLYHRDLLNFFLNRYFKDFFLNLRTATLTGTNNLLPFYWRVFSPQIHIFKNFVNVVNFTFQFFTIKWPIWPSLTVTSSFWTSITWITQWLWTCCSVTLGHLCLV